MIGMASGSIWHRRRHPGKDNEAGIRQMSGFWMKTVESQEHYFDSQPARSIPHAHLEAPVEYARDEQEVMLEEMRRPVIALIVHIIGTHRSRDHPSRLTPRRMEPPP